MLASVDIEGNVDEDVVVELFIISASCIIRLLLVAVCLSFWCNCFT